MQHFSITQCLVAILSILSLANLSYAQDRPIKIVLAGDSTVSEHTGWGPGLQKFVVAPAQVVNLALQGRSSRSFRDEGAWQKCLDARPNYILIQFGHNDQPGKGPQRETDAATTFRQNLSRYVDETRAIGATPVLLTSLARRRWDDHGQIKSDLLDYVQATRAVAAQKKVLLIDLHDRSIEYYNSLGKSGAELIAPAPGEDGPDVSHLNAAGSEMFGAMIADELARQVKELRPVIRIVAAGDRVASTQAVSTAGDPVHDRQGPARPQGSRTITVAADGSGEFRTVQEAIAAAPDNNTDRTTIRIRPGRYYGIFVVPNCKPNLTFEGQDPATTVLTYALNVNDPVPANVPARFNGNATVVLGRGFHARNITFENTSGDHGQAMALRVAGDRAVFENCRFVGWQDTLHTHSARQYFKNCSIEGRVDFIYGASTAVFDHCQIQSKMGGYITASSAPQEQAYGLVFLDCKLTSDDKTPTHLGRPWRPYAQVAFVRCEMGPHIRPEGWDNWRNPANEATARYFEFQCTGPGADRGKRVAWSHELPADDAKRYTPAGILAGDDQWNLK